MSYGSNKRSESSASRRSMDGDTTEDGGDERDESKRRSRNLSEKKRRDQFNVLINELCSMVSTSPRKMDKSTVLKATIAFLKAHNELSTQSQVQETQEDWKPSFLSNEEFTHLMLEALDGFIIVISSDGIILYLSESITSLLGYLSTDLVRGNGTIYDYILPEERNELFEILTNPSEEKYKGQISLVLNFLVGGLETTEQSKKFQLVKLVGYFKRWISPTDCGAKSTEKSSEFSESSCVSGNGCVLIATGRLVICDLLREMSVVVDSEKNEFSSRHSLEWKFLFLDHRAPPIIGYLPFEVLGTSGYDYYHVEDLEKVATCHEALMQRGEGTSCYYRFLTKGQQWIWLQTRFFITYHQWNSKPEFIVCTHRVVSYADVMKERNGETPSSAFQDGPTRSGPSLAKQSKMESLKTSKSSSRQKNGGVNYGSGTSKRNSNHRKLELPPKFATAMSPSRLVHPHTQPSALQLPQTITTPENSIASSNIVNSKPLSTNVTMSLHPPGPQEVHPHQQPTLSSSVHRSSTTVEDVSVPVAPYRVPEESTFAATSTEAIPTGIPLAQGQSVVASTTPCILQEQLLKKHAELQRQIIEQQEELRRVSEQLLMSQCGWIQEPALLHPSHNQPVHHAQPVELQTAAPPNMTTYSSHSGPPQPPPPTSVSSPNNPESGLP